MSVPKELSFWYVHQFYTQARETVFKRRGYRPFIVRDEERGAAANWDREVAAEFLRLLKKNGIAVHTK